MDISRALAYSVASITSVAGIIITAGWFVPETVPSRLRVTFGVVLILLGIYRYAVTNAKIARSQHSHD